jgi:putative FmdB family regulatory protein
VPSYDYVCECGEQFERVSSMAEMKSKLKCPVCGKMAKRAIGRPNAIVRHRYIDNIPRKNRGRGY